MTQTDVPPVVSIVFGDREKGGERGAVLAGGQELNFGFGGITKTPCPCGIEGDRRWSAGTEEPLTYNVLRKLQFELTHRICVITHK